MLKKWGYTIALLKTGLCKLVESSVTQLCIGRLCCNLRY